jgi:hypothetical protein
MTSACAESPLIHCGAASQEAHLYAHLRGVVPLCAAGIRLRAGIAAGVQGMLVTVRSSMYADYDKSIVLRLPGEVLSEIIGSSCGSYSAYLYRLRESRRADSNR